MAAILFPHTPRDLLIAALGLGSHAYCSNRSLETVQCAYAFILRSKAQTIFLAGLFRLVSTVAQALPERIRTGWTAFLPPDEPATSPTWDTVRVFLPLFFFLCDLLSIDDHTTLLRIAHPSLRAFASFLTGGHIREFGEPELTVQLLNEAIDPQYPIFEILSDKFRAGQLSPEAAHYFFNSTRALIATLPLELRDPAWTHSILPVSPEYSGRLLSSNFAIPRRPHKDLSLEPYPVMDMADYDSMWHWWQQLQERRRSSEEPPSPSALQSVTSGSWAPHVRRAFVMRCSAFGLAFRFSNQLSPPRPSNTGPAGRNVPQLSFDHQTRVLAEPSDQPLFAGHMAQGLNQDKREFAKDALGRGLVLNANIYSAVPHARNYGRQDGRVFGPGLPTIPERT
ncbi:hypothetical protein B0H14DRAFT_2655199 [Mycena olivaceomarginata]|nr:hypothetical protein B0H14DRAFT_2655199 [Mycena olivaceomarginata]